MFETRLSALYGLKYNPFLPALPIEALWDPPNAAFFIRRIEALARTGGFALITGESGIGKSKLLQGVAGHLDALGDATVRVMERPQSRLGDFYRELGELFGVQLTVANRYGGFCALRDRWREHVKTTLLRPVLLIDEAQEVPAACLNELRLLTSAEFDSKALMTAVLCGDSRLPERFRAPELLPLGTRIRTRLVLEPYGSDDLLAYLDHALQAAGAPHLMTDELKQALADHSAGNLRLLCTMAGELLAVAAERELVVLDDTLFVDAFSPRPTARPPKKRRRGTT